jgi:hypothetical protein
VSTKSSIKWRAKTEGSPGFHIYEDTSGSFGADDVAEPPVYLSLDGVAVQVETLGSGGAAVTIAIPRELARELGLLPNGTDSDMP